jgi:hypothetical protein
LHEAVFRSAFWFEQVLCGAHFWGGPLVSQTQTPKDIVTQPPPPWPLEIITAITFGPRQFRSPYKEYKEYYLQLTDVLRPNHSSTTSTGVLNVGAMGFTDLVADAGLTSEFTCQQSLREYPLTVKQP